MTKYQILYAKVITLDNNVDNLFILSGCLNDALSGYCNNLRAIVHKTPPGAGAPDFMNGISVSLYDNNKKSKHRKRLAALPSIVQKTNFKDDDIIFIVRNVESGDIRFVRAGAEVIDLLIAAEIISQ